jgi:hypothetical protein
MLKSLIIAAAFAFVATNALAADATAPQADPYASPIEQCIRDNAAKVEASIADLNQAVDFLVGKVCAGPIADHNMERQKFVQQRTFENMQKLCDEQSAAKPAAIDYCQLVKNASRTTMQPVPYDPWSSGALLGGNSSPPAAVALASQLLLDLRAAHKHRNN